MGVDLSEADAHSICDGIRDRVEWSVCLSLWEICSKTGPHEYRILVCV